jgi:hypothetical protein
MDAIKDGIENKLPSREEPEIIEAIMEKPNVELDKNTSLLIVQEVNAKTIVAIIDGTETRYSIPSWFGDTTIEVGTYIVVKHAESSLPTYPMQFGFIHGMTYYSSNGTIIEGVKP